MLKWLLIILAIIVGLIVLAMIVGSLLPRSHVASRTVALDRSPDEVWAVLTDFAGQASWRKDLARVERMPDHDGHEVWREVAAGGDAMPLETLEAVASRRLVRKIADPKLPFVGTWTYELEPTGGADQRGCRLTITERGEVYNPIFRLVSKFMDMNATIDGFLRALELRLTESPEPGR